MKKNLLATITENTTPWKNFKEDFTQAENKISQAEVKYYDVLLTLKEVRKKLGLTQEQLSKKANLPRTTITKVESGSYNPTLQTLMTIASAMGKRLQISFL